MMHYWGQPYMRGCDFKGNGSLGLIITIFFCVAVAFLFLILVKGFRRQIKENGYEGENANKSLNMLKERYAKGEINKKEFDEIKKDIS